MSCASLETWPVTLRGLGQPTFIAEAETTFNDDEGVARHDLSNILGQDSRSVVRGLTSPDWAVVVPDFFLGAPSQRCYPALDWFDLTKLSRRFPSLDRGS